MFKPMECPEKPAGGWLRADGRKRSVRHGSPNGKAERADIPGDGAQRDERFRTAQMQNKNGAARSSAIRSILLILALLAVLIRNAAGSLACRLARSLALTASAVCLRLSHVSCRYGLDPLHFYFLRFLSSHVGYHPSWAVSTLCLI